MRFGLMAAVWLLVAVGIGATGALTHLRPPAPQLILGSLTLVLLAGWRFSSGFRQSLQAVDLRALIAIHVSRFVGFYFLFLCGRGELPCSFATTAGWGDVVVAAIATLFLIFWKQVGTSRRWLALWNG